MLFFFFQAEDGIRDYKVTGVQTCALPIFRPALAVVARVERELPTAVEIEPLGALEIGARVFGKWNRTLRGEGHGRKQTVSGSNAKRVLMHRDGLPTRRRTPVRP